MSKLSPTEIADQIAAIARVLDQPELARQREYKLQHDFIIHVANTEAVPSTIRRKARSILDVAKWEIER